ncbi:MAG TPA: CheR family methyltransferase, partial [Steroidobacteraceae bacterium]|nr:CheR family methyltransferase [Steroidobacteraceae bacterium]
LAMWHLHHGAGTFELEVHATDINPQFLELARKAEYPMDVARGLTEAERSWFAQEGATLRVPDAARALVTFLPPMDFVRKQAEDRFDAVLIMNALTYVTPGEQRLAIAGAAASAESLLALTAFHPDHIRRDIEAVGFQPLMKNHEAIHNGWGDRLANRPIDPASSEYSWRLPRYDASIQDYAFRFAALFQREVATGAHHRIHKDSQA